MSIVISLEGQFDDIEGACDLVEATMMELSRESHYDMEQKCEMIKERINHLNRLYMKTRGCRGPLNKLINDTDTYNKSASWKSNIGIAIGVCGIVLTIIIFVYSYFCQ